MAGLDTSLTTASEQPYVEVDVTDWPLVGDEIRGTKPKCWLLHPDTGCRWLFKETTENVYSDGAAHRKGDDWSERVANAVAVCIGLPVAQVELAVRHRPEDSGFGVISLSVLADASDPSEPEELIDGNQVLRQPVLGRDRSSYTLVAIADALQDVEVPADMGYGLSDLTAWDVFVGYLVLDAVVGNTDRHEENWAVIAQGDRLRLAPSFDHASCLGFQLDDEKRKRRLATRDQGFTPEAYADRARSHFAEQPHPVTVARQALAMSAPRVADLWLDRCSKVDRLVEPVWLVPEHRMSAEARQFAERVVRQNCRRLFARSD